MNCYPNQELLRPGMVLAVRTTGLVARLIQAGEALRGLPALNNHVAVMHHFDSKGVPWGLGGQPGGVAWHDLRAYLASPYTVVNWDQPLDGDGELIAGEAERMLGTEYDWRGIAADAAEDIGLGALFRVDWRGKGMPGQVVCSSYAAWLYEYFGKPHPDTGRERQCQPADWTAFIMSREWTLS